MSGRIVHGEEYSQPGERRRLERRAKSFRRDERMEKLISLLASDHTLDAKISPTLRASLGYYRAAKSAAEELDELTS